MITSIRLVNFKNFADETLRVGPFTVIVGANASGKSNIRDAFRFLHGIGRGYSLAEIIGGKYGADWKPIRGAANEIVRFGEDAFSIEVRMELGDADACYLIEVSNDKERRNEFRFAKEELTGVFKPDIFANMSFLELSPDRMREPAFPGATVLGDSGENLPVVLEDICADPKRKEILADWLSELTPMDMADFEFPRDPSGRVHLTLCETNGRKVSAYSASDGTLRFLAMLVVLLGENPAGLYFFEEIDNGIHPVQLNLLMDLIERQTAKHGIQVLTTTHAPTLLTVVSHRRLKPVGLSLPFPSPSNASTALTQRHSDAARHHGMRRHATRRNVQPTDTRLPPWDTTGYPRHVGSAAEAGSRHSRTRSTRSVLSGCNVDSYHKPAKQFYPSSEGAFSLRSPLAPLLVTHPVGIRAQQQYRLYSGTPQRLVRCAAHRRGYTFFL